MSSQFQQDSTMSTPVSIQAMSSSSSDVEFIVSLNEGGDSNSSSTAQGKLVHPEFAFSDGNIEVQTRDQLFWIHEFQLKKFSKLSHCIEDARAAGTTTNFIQRIKISCNISGLDFANTLQVVYASVIKGPSQFDKDILTSALRIATTYEYPDLREFAVVGLENANLTAIDRIRLSDEFVLRSWEKPAFMELCQRREAISPSEAKVLGMDRFVEIARIREAEQRHQLVGDLLEAVQADCLSVTRKKTLAALVAPVSSTLTSLPDCNCYLGITNGNYVVVKCSLHNLAPQVFAECQSLLKERNELQDDLVELTTTLASQKSKLTSGRIGESAGANECDGYISLENELAKAAWIRPIHTDS